MKKIITSIFTSFIVLISLNAMAAFTNKNSDGSPYNYTGKCKPSTNATNFCVVDVTPAFSYTASYNGHCSYYHDKAGTDLVGKVACVISIKNYDVDFGWQTLSVATYNKGMCQTFNNLMKTDKPYPFDWYPIEIESMYYGCGEQYEVETHNQSAHGEAGESGVYQSTTYFGDFFL